MKKNFFKKLSFVLALAMIVTALAPAAGAFAAKAPKLNASSKYLYLGVDGKDEYDFNISNKVKGWKYLWTTANDDVVSVNKKNGLVTAEAAGSTKVSVVITDKDGEEVDELTATVTVRDNIKTLTITNLPKDGKVAVGVAHDFNRSYVTVANKTKGSYGVTRWSVSPSEGATISDMGVFTATKAGEYTVTARAFQSKSKYTSWLSDATKYASYVTSNEATYKVKVAASMVKAEQVDLDTFKLSFDSEVTDTTKLAIVRLVGTTEIIELAKKVTLSEDKKVATVDMHNEFAAGATYVVRYTDMKDVQFIAATTKAEDVKEIKILTTQVQVFEPTTIKIALLNANGVNIANSDLLTRVTLETADTNLYLQNKDVTMYTIGNTATLTAKFHTWKYDGGTEVGALEVKGVVTCVEKVLDKATSIVASDVATSYDNFKKVNHTIAVDDTGYRLFVKTLIKLANGDDDYENNSDNTLTGVDGWQMSTSNNSVLLVDDLGNLTPVGIGTASVIVKWDEVVVGSIAITVGARREVSVVSLNSNQFTLSNDDDVNDNKVIEVTVKDQYGDKMDGGKYNLALDRTSQPATGTYVNTLVDTAKAAGSDGSQKYKFETPMGATTTTGTYVYKITATDTTSWKNMPTYVTVSVAAPTSDTASTSYRLEAGNTTYDMNLNEWSGDNATDVTVSLFGYASNGIRNQRVALNTVTVDILGAGTGYEGAVGHTTVGQDYVIHLTPASGTQIVKADKGSWTVTAVSGTAISTSVTFGVQDTQAVPTYTFDSPYATLDGESDPLVDADVVAAIDKAITFNLKGDEIPVANLINLDYSVVGKTVYVRSVQYRELLSNSNYIEHTINIGKTITVK